jgi:hypothetical protein
MNKGIKMALKESRQNLGGIYKKPGIGWKWVLATTITFVFNYTVVLFT